MKKIINNIILVYSCYFVIFIVTLLIEYILQPRCLLWDIITSLVFLLGLIYFIISLFLLKYLNKSYKIIFPLIVILYHIFIIVVFFIKMIE